MSAAQYAAHRLRLTAVFALRVLCACGIVYVWEDLQSLEKAVAIAAAVIVVPGLNAVKKLFMPYERYLRDGEAGEARRG